MLPLISSDLFIEFIENMPDAIIITPQNGLIEIVNSKVYNVFGYMPEELIGEKIEILVPKSLREKHSQNVDGYFENPQDKKMGAHRRVSGIRKDGSEFEIDITLASLTVDNKLYAIASCRNISDKKDLEKELQAENIGLHTINKSLEKYNYTVSHDLKAPLAKIEGLIELLLSEINDGKSRDKLIEIQEYLKDSVSAMRNLISAVLNEAKKTQTEEDKEILHFADIYSEIKKLIVIPKNFTINIHCDSLILPGKKIQFIQVFLNLFSNAIKFNDKSEGIIDIKCECIDDDYKFTFSDNGPGISKEKLNKIFNLFEKGIEGKPSNGIGLYTVKSIVESRGGKIKVSNMPEEGAKFEFTWPKQKHNQGK